MQNFKRYGSWGLITGAGRAEGLGYSFARLLAQQGMNLVLVDVLADEVTQRAEELRQLYQIEARGVVLDLEPADFMERLQQDTADVEIGLLVCNHMYTPKETPLILDMDLDVHHRMIDINSRAYTTLIHHYGRAMRARKQGAIVIVSSGAGLIHTPYTGAYAANKSFQIGLGEALWYEVRPFGIDVVVLAAGLMDTQGDALAKYPQFMVMKSEDVARETLAALGKKPLVIPGRINKLFTFMQMHLMSRKRAIESIGRFMDRGLGKS